MCGQSHMNFVSLLVHGLSAMSVFSDRISARLLAAASLLTGLGLAIFFWVLNILLDTVGHLAFKSAAVEQHAIGIQRWKRMLSSAPLWIGIACFGIEFGVWFALLSLIPLSLAMLIGSINIVVVMLAGRLLFQERLDRMRVAGMSLITLGVALAGGFA